MDELQPIPTFYGDGRREENILETIKKTNQIGHWYNWSDEQKCKAIPLRLQGTASDTYSEYSQEVKADWEALVTKLTADFGKQRSKLMSTRELRHRTQQPDETTTDYFRAKEELARQAYKGDPKAERDKAFVREFILGLREPFMSNVTRRIGESEDPDFARSLALEEERIEAMQKASSSSSALQNRIAELEEEMRQLHMDRVAQVNVVSSSSKKCYTCGRRGHIAWMCRKSRTRGENNIKEPLSSKTCYNCGRRGHIAWMCRNYRSSGESNSSSESHDSDSSSCSQGSYREPRRHSHCRRQRNSYRRDGCRSSCSNDSQNWRYRSESSSSSDSPNWRNQQHFESGTVGSSRVGTVYRVNTNRLCRTEHDQVAQSTRKEEREDELGNEHRTGSERMVQYDEREIAQQAVSQSRDEWIQQNKEVRHFVKEIVENHCDVGDQSEGEVAEKRCVVVHGRVNDDTVTKGNQKCKQEDEGLKSKERAFQLGGVKSGVMIISAITVAVLHCVLLTAYYYLLIGSVTRTITQHETIEFTKELRGIVNSYKHYIEWMEETIGDLEKELGEWREYGLETGQNTNDVRNRKYRGPGKAASMCTKPDNDQRKMTNEWFEWKWRGAREPKKKEEWESIWSRLRLDIGNGQRTIQRNIDGANV